MQRLQPNFTTDGIRNFMAQQKQRKQPILIDGKNIFSYCFQSIQRLQPNFTTDGIRNFMVQQKQRKQLLLTDDKNIFTYYCFQYNGDNPKLRIFSFIPTTTYAAQFYESYIPNSKPNKHNPNNQNNDINVGFTTTQSLCSYN